jgi:3-oxoacyl-[acyl-carrier protein] reductase
MDLGLKGKVALVTGAGSQIGFGKAIALTLAKEGCDVVVNALHIEGAQKTADEITALGRKSMAIIADISKKDEVKDMVAGTIKEFGKIDILVNNAGAGSPPKPFIETTEEEWDRDIDVNLKGMLNCTKAVLPHMIARKQGKIINVSSMGGKTGGADATVYCAAKAAEINFTKGLAAEVAALGISVNCVAPGVGLTNFVRNAPPGALDHLKEKIPIKRTTTPEDIAGAVAYLASDISSDVVGQTLSVDGGLT